MEIWGCWVRYIIIPLCMLKKILPFLLKGWSLLKNHAKKYNLIIVHKCYNLEKRYNAAFIKKSESLFKFDDEKVFQVVSGKVKLQINESSVSMEIYMIIIRNIQLQLHSHSLLNSIIRMMIFIYLFINKHKLYYFLFYYYIFYFYHNMWI